MMISNLKQHGCNGCHEFVGWLLLSLALIFLPCSLSADTNIPFPLLQVDKTDSKLRGDLQALATLSENAAASRSLKTNAQPWVVIDAVAKGDPQQLLSDLKQLGLRAHAVFGNIVSGQLPLAALAQLEALPSLNEVSVSRVFYASGITTTQGDKAQASDRARAHFNVTGQGVTVAVISDSFNCLDGMAQDQATGDLPSDVVIIEEPLNCEGTTDEGRALAQIIHDIAPDAKLLFHTGSNGLAKTANAILDLAFKHQVDVIIDDAKFLNANFYQHDAISQAIQRVVDAGVTYVTAAGNEGRNAYESTYREYQNLAFGIQAHNFASTETPSIYQRLHVPEGIGFTILLQWEEPAYSISGGQGAQADLDIFIFDQYRSQVLAASTFNNVGKDPVEVLDFFNPQGSGRTQFDLMITQAAGKVPPSFKYIILNSIDGIIQSHATHSGGLFGHANTEAAITVGASNYQETPAFGVSPPLLQYFSSAGGQAITFDQSGKRIPPLIPSKPDLVAPDNVNTTFFKDNDSDQDGFPNIAGSSAAAPHAAAVVALILETNPALQPQDVKAILQQTAIDIVQRNNEQRTFIGEGYNLDSGYGLINAEAAVSVATTYLPAEPNNTTDESAITVNPIKQGGGALSVEWLVLLSLLALIWRQSRVKCYG